MENRIVLAGICACIKNNKAAVQKLADEIRTRCKWKAPADALTDEELNLMVEVDNLRSEACKEMQEFMQI